MQRMYEQEHLSRGEIARVIGTSVQSVTRVLTRRGVAFDDRPALTKRLRTAEEQAAINLKVSAARAGKGTGPRSPVEKRTCENRSCGKEFEYHAGQTGERFCSRTCRNEYASFVNKEAAKDAYELDPKRCPCSAAIPFDYRHTRQFCSPEHRREYQAKRQKDPENWVTFNCLNCGTEVTRPKNYGGSMVQKYCSNECSAKHNRTKQHIVIEDAMVLDSPYEALFYGLLRLWKIPVERADRSRAISVNGSGWYCPDFYLPDMDIWVEIKGFEEEDHRLRYAAWRMFGRKLAVLRRLELHSLRTCLTRDGAVEHLRSLSSLRLSEDHPGRFQAVLKSLKLASQGTGLAGRPRPPREKNLRLNAVLHPGLHQVGEVPQPLERGNGIRRAGVERSRPIPVRPGAVGGVPHHLADAAHDLHVLRLGQEQPLAQVLDLPSDFADVNGPSHVVIIQLFLISCAHDPYCRAG